MLTYLCVWAIASGNKCVNITHSFFLFYIWYGINHLLSKKDDPSKSCTYFTRKKSTTQCAFCLVIFIFFFPITNVSSISSEKCHACTISGHPHQTLGQTPIHNFERLQKVKWAIVIFLLVFRFI